MKKITSPEYVSSTGSSRLGLLTRIRSCLSLEASKQGYALLAQLLFDYADAACSVKSSKDVAKISSDYKTVQLELFLEGQLQKTHYSIF